MTKRRLPLLLPLVMAVTTATAMAKHPVVGSYNRGSVDSLEQIIAFSNKKFCVAVMAGSLDLVTVGNWYDAEQGYVEFKEDKSEQPMFVVVPRKPEATRSVQLHGYTASRAEKMALAFDDGELRPVFDADRHTFSSRYTINIPSNAKTLRLSAVVDSKHHRVPQTHVETYNLPQTGEVVVFYNSEAARPAMSFVAKVTPKGIEINGRPTSKKELSAADEDRLYQQCSSASQEARVLPPEALSPLRVEDNASDNVPVGQKPWVEPGNAE